MKKSQITDDSGVLSMPVECITFGIMDPWWMPQDLPVCAEQLVINTTADMTCK